MDMESISHLFISCPFTKAVWQECMRLIGLNIRWEGASVISAWEGWWRTVPQSTQKSFPLIFIWGIWLARNGATFQDKSFIPEVISAHSVGIFKTLPEPVRADNQRRDLYYELDKSQPWGFFDGAAQNDVCGGGAYLYLSDSHYFSIIMGLGAGTNNYAEMLSLKLLLIFALEKGVKRLTVLGDSMNVINWVKLTQACRNIRLANILSSIQTVTQSFDFFNCRHVYRENNKEADQASKDGLRLAYGTWKITEVRDGQSSAYYHRPFID